MYNTCLPNTTKLITEIKEDLKYWKYAVFISED